jgi:hypothetical protein
MQKVLFDAMLSDVRRIPLGCYDDYAGDTKHFRPK